MIDSFQYPARAVREIFCCRGASALRLVAVAACLAASGALPGAAYSQDSLVRGAVFVDANANGHHDAGEPGVAGVSVSNQLDVVVSDSDGRFRIDRGSSGIVMVSAPTDYRTSGTFWRKLDANAASVEFGLIRSIQPRTFSFVHASDPHIAPNVVGRFRRFAQLTDSINPAFVLIAGDLVRDAMSTQETTARSYFELFTTESKNIKAPLWLVPGNHDHFAIIPSRLRVDPAHPGYNRGMYREYFGPDYYSFNYGGVHFVALNTLSVDDSAYYGDVDSVQLAWLKQDMSHVPRTMPVVTFNHIPLVSGFHALSGFIDMALVSDIAKVKGVTRYRHVVGNAFDVFEVMRDHNYVLALGGHMHAAEHLDFVTDGMRIRFDVSAAIVGPQDMGVMTIPSGFTLYTVRAGAIDSGKFVRLDQRPDTSAAK